MNMTKSLQFHDSPSQFSTSEFHTLGSSLLTSRAVTVAAASTAAASDGLVTASVNLWRWSRAGSNA